MNLVEKNDESAKTPDKTKRPYEAPVLSEYGDIRQITQNVPMGHGASDHAGGPNKTLP